MTRALASLSPLVVAVVAFGCSSQTDKECTQLARVINAETEKVAVARDKSADSQDAALIEKLAVAKEEAAAKIEKEPASGSALASARDDFAASFRRQATATRGLKSAVEAGDRAAQARARRELKSLATEHVKAREAITAACRGE